MKKVEKIGIDVNADKTFSNVRVGGHANVQKKKRIFSFFGRHPKNKQKGVIDVGQQKMSVRFLNFAISVSLFMIFFGVPLFFTGRAFQGIVFEKEIYFYFWILLVMVLWALKGVITGEMRIRKTPLDIPIVIFWLIYLTATLFSVDKWHSFWGFFGDPSRGLINVTALIIAYYLIVSNFTPKKMLWMIGGLVVANLFISLWAVSVFYNIAQLPDNVRSLIPLSLIGTMSGLKIFSGMMLPILIMATIKMLESKKRLFRIFAVIPLITIFLNLLLILILPQRILSLIILLGVGFFLLYILSNIVRSTKKGLTWVPMTAFVLMTIVLIVGSNNFAKVKPPIEIIPDFQTSWSVAKNSLKNDLFIGSGPATYGYAFSAYKPQSFNQNIFYELRFYQALGLFFESISTIGLLGTILLLVIAITYINVTLYLITKGDYKNRIYSLGLLSASLVSIISAFLMRVEGTIVILGAILGALTMATMLWESNVEEKYLKLSLKASPKFALTLAFIFIIVSAGVATLFVYIGKAYVADLYAGRANQYDKISEDGSIKSMIRAIGLNPREGRYYSRVGQEYMVLANREASKDNAKDNVGKIRTYINNSLLYADAGARYMPKDALAVSVLAQVRESLGLYDRTALDKALETYQRLADLEPHNPSPYMKMGQIRLAMAVGEKDKNKKKELIGKAIEDFQKAIDEKNNLSDAYYYMALSKSALDDKNGAIEAMTNAVKIDPNNTTYLFNLGKLYQDRGGKEDVDNARKIFEYLLTVNPNDLMSSFSLAYLLDTQGEKDAAIKAYEKTIELVSKSKAQNKDEVKKQLEKMIENVKNGISNKQATVLNNESNNDQKVEEVKKEELIGNEQQATQDENKTNNQ